MRDLREKSLSMKFRSRLMQSHFPKGVTTEIAVEFVLPRHGKLLIKIALFVRVEVGRNGLSCRPLENVGAATCCQAVAVKSSAMRLSGDKPSATQLLDCTPA